MKFGIAVFPGTWSDRDCRYWIESAGHEAVMLWHKESDLNGADCVILPGGFSYGDYLRCGAIARFAPLMQSVIDFANSGGLVFGICNGFQILCESGLLPGALTRNESLQFRCMPTTLSVETTKTPFTQGLVVGQEVVLPVSHGEGRFVADQETLESLERSGRVVFRYCGESPNGSMNGIAGIVNEGGNVLGMMPHPERACEPLLGSADGRMLLESVANTGALA